MTPIKQSSTPQIERQNMMVSEVGAKILNAFLRLGSMREAYDHVMGEGAYVKLAGEVYDELRKQK